MVLQWETSKKASIRFFHGICFFLQKEVVESIGNPAGIRQGTGLGLRERDRDGIGLGLSRLRANFGTCLMWVPQAGGRGVALVRG